MIAANVLIVIFLLPLLGTCLALKVGLSRSAIPREGRGLTKQERRAVLLSLALTPLMWVLSFLSFYFAIFTVPVFGAFQGILVAVTARTSRPLLLALLGTLPFTAVLLILAFSNGARVYDLPWLLITVAIITLLPLVVALPLHFRARTGFQSRP